MGMATVGLWPRACASGRPHLDPPVMALSVAFVGSAPAASARWAVHGGAKGAALPPSHCCSRSVGGARGGAPAGRGGGPRFIGCEHVVLGGSRAGGVAAGTPSVYFHVTRFRDAVHDRPSLYTTVLPREFWGLRDVCGRGGLGWRRSWSRGQELEQERTREQGLVASATCVCGRNCDCDRGCRYDCDCGYGRGRHHCADTTRSLPV